MINSLKLRGLMLEKEITQKDLAKMLGLSQPAVNQKINNVRSMTLEEAFEIKRILQISDKDFGAYFFSPEVA